ncbi:MAG: hypothetical protein KAQ85_09970 [Thermodesulfovibrionia bacterium]|nr:hypothetical protein [Thermodesulfovibrionia bacterium]MCK5332989.1 hypothetical protein [Candidatus Aenigmarchaeota archaeon]
MDVTAVGVIVDEKRAVLEKALKNSLVDSYEIDDLDKTDSRKDVFVCLANPVDSKYVAGVLSEIFEGMGTKKTGVE